jgi:hypothetical protein
MKFPKERGDYSGMGNSMARFLDTPNGSGGLTNWLHKVHTDLDGSIVYASNKGGHLEVRRTPVPSVVLDGLYTASAASATGPGRAVVYSYSQDTAGIYTVNYSDWVIPEQVWVVHEGVSNSGQWMGPLYYSAVYPSGSAYGETAMLVPTGEAWPNAPYPGVASYDRYRMTVLATRDSLHFTQTLTDIYTTSGSWGYKGSGFVGTKKKPVQQSEWTIATQDALMLTAHYVRRFADGKFAVTDMDVPRDRANPVMFVSTLSPNVRIALRFWKYVNTTVQENPASFAISTDAGATWAPLSVPPFDEDFQVFYAKSPTSVPNVLNRMTMVCMPLDGNTAVMLVNVPYIYEYPVDGQGIYYIIFDRVKLLRINIADGAVLSTVTVWDSFTDSGWTNGEMFHEHMWGMAYIVGMTPATGGVHILTQPTPLKPNNAVNYDQPRLMQFTPDGLSFTDVYTMPYNMGYVGTVRTSGPDTLICPMFSVEDGRTYLMQSKTRGAVWEPIGLMYVGGPPENTNDTGLDNFGVINKIRNLDGTPAPFYPACPWIRDIRVDPPT